MKIIKSFYILLILLTISCITKPVIRTGIVIDKGKIMENNIVYIYIRDTVTKMVHHGYLSNYEQALIKIGDTVTINAPYQHSRYNW